ncbi:MAG: ornithine cyclodeaminase family protein [Pseudomonadales bacterium]
MTDYRPVRILTLEQMQRHVDLGEARRAIADGFIAYSRGLAVTPPVGEMVFEDPPGDVHVKSAWIQGDAHFVIKTATGFYDNARRGLPANDGALLVYERDTGRLVCVLVDRGWLTDLRTALAGALAAEALAPAEIRTIGVLGTGVQARLQVECLADVTPCRQVRVWGRDAARVEQCCEDLAARGFHAVPAETPEAMNDCQLIVSTTASRQPVLQRLPSGCHLTAVGTDSPHKNEIAAAVFGSADLVVADSIPQCSERGDLHHALAAGAIDLDRVVELGRLLAAEHPGRTDDNQRTIADLTGVAVQDVRIAQHVMKHLAEDES